MNTHESSMRCVWQSVRKRSVSVKGPLSSLAPKQPLSEKKSREGQQNDCAKSLDHQKARGQAQGFLKHKTNNNLNAESGVKMGVCVCVCVQAPFGCPHLDDDVSLAGAAAVQLAMLLHHDDLALLLHLVSVLLHMVEDAPVVLLGDAHKLVHNHMRTLNELVVEEHTALG